MKAFIKKYEIWIFLVLAPIVNVLFVYVRAEGHMNSFSYNHGRFGVLLLLLVLIVKFTRGNEGIKDMFRPMLKWKVHPKWYLLSLIFAFTIASLTLILKNIYHGVEFSSLLNFDVTIKSLNMTFIVLIWAFMGEVVWVSYCIRQLSKITNPFYASQIVGVVWTLWWMPIVLHGEAVIPDFPFWFLLVGMMGTAGMCAVVYGHTKSGIAVWLLQFMLNMSLLMLAVSPRRGGIPTYATFVILYYLVMLGFMYFMLKPKNKVSMVK
ncbi:hypothetical protein [uncultured Winogradskyella sp.]|uniref:hypothetical protein n=1 Tax=uncultured Winogradskyella sp. TaxID=395353 RepID=UPI0026216481|nr:hypothetical protein [uncultured Winogradskyella sp.]